MTNRKVSTPNFPIPPKEYSQSYMAEIIRAFSLYTVQQNTPGEGRHTEMVLTNLPTNDVTLEPGGLFQVSNHVLISTSTAAYVMGLTGTGSVGSVTTT